MAMMSPMKKHGDSYNPGTTEHPKKQKQFLRAAYPTYVGPQACGAQDDRALVRYAEVDCALTQLLSHYWE
jgi:hypothetical protein